MFSCSYPEGCHTEPRHNEESHQDWDEGGDEEERNSALGDDHVVGVDTGGVDVAGGGDHEAERDEDEDESHDQEPDWHEGMAGTGVKIHHTHHNSWGKREEIEDIPIKLVYELPAML